MNSVGIWGKCVLGRRNNETKCPEPAECLVSESPSKEASVAGEERARERKIEETGRVMGSQVV